MPNKFNNEGYKNINETYQLSHMKLQGGANSILNNNDLPPMRMMVPPNPMRVNQTILSRPPGTIIEDVEYSRMSNIQDNNKIVNPVYSMYENKQQNNQNESRQIKNQQYQDSNVIVQDKNVEQYQKSQYYPQNIQHPYNMHSMHGMHGIPNIHQSSCPCCRGSGYVIPPMYSQLLDMFSMNKKYKYDINFYLVIGIFILLVIIIIFLLVKKN
jgi:hypothetical protein